MLKRTIRQNKEKGSMRQGTANLNRMIRKNSQIKWLSEQLKERRQEATGTCGGGTFSRMDSERKTAKVQGGHTAGTAGNPVGLTRVMIFRRQSWQPSTGTWTAPLQERREGGRLRHRCRHLSGRGGGRHWSPVTTAANPSWEGRSRRCSRF